MSTEPKKNNMTILAAALIIVIIVVAGAAYYVTQQPANVTVETTTAIVTASATQQATSAQLKIAMILPGSDFGGKDLLIGNAPVKTLIGQNGKFGFGHIEPTAVLGRVMPFETLDQAPGLGRRERLVE